MTPVVITCIALVLASTPTVGAARVLQRRLLFYPDGRHPISSLRIPGLRMISAGEQGSPDLAAWYVPASHGLPTVAYFHGNAGKIGDREGRMAAFARAGIGILMVEYPGFGGELGRASKKGLVKAGRRALAFLDRSGVPSHKVILYGESIGTGIATRLATERKVGGLILESPYTSILDIACQLVPWLPVRLLLSDRFEQLSLITMVHAPLLILQGALDRIVPPAMGQAVFAAANQPKRLWTAPKGGHNDLAVFGAMKAAIAFVLEEQEQQGRPKR